MTPKNIPAGFRSIWLYNPDFFKSPNFARHKQLTIWTQLLSGLLSSSASHLSLLSSSAKHLNLLSGSAYPQKLCKSFCSTTISKWRTKEDYLWDKKEEFLEILSGTVHLWRKLYRKKKKIGEKQKQKCLTKMWKRFWKEAKQYREKASQHKVQGKQGRGLRDIRWWRFLHCVHETLWKFKTQRDVGDAGDAHCQSLCCLKKCVDVSDLNYNSIIDGNICILINTYYFFTYWTDVIFQ